MSSTSTTSAAKSLFRSAGGVPVQKFPGMLILVLSLGRRAVVVTNAAIPPRAAVAPAPLVGGAVAVDRGGIVSAKRCAFLEEERKPNSATQHASTCATGCVTEFRSKHDEGVFS